MKFYLNRNIDIRETGFVLQPKLFWLAASPDSLVSDKSNEDVRQIGLIEIKCPKSKKNSKISDLLHDQSFYVKYEDGVPVLKKDHPNGYYTQIQMAMGLSQITFCDFIVYTFDGMIIIRTQFDEDYFFFSTAKTKQFLQRLYATKTSNQSKKLYNLEHISKLQGGQRELEEHALQNLLEVVSLVKVLHNNFLVGTV